MPRPRRRRASRRADVRPRRAARSRSGYHHGDLRRVLIAGALELAAERGAAALTLRELARRAGVTPAAPYRHFAGKDALIAAVAEQGFRSMLERVRRALVRAGPDPAARLRALGAAYVRFAVDRPAHFRVMFGREVARSHGFTALWDVAQSNFGVLVGEIVAAQRAGAVAGDDPRGPALAAWSAVHGLALLLVDGLAERQGLGPRPRQGVEALATGVMDALLAGVVRGRRRRGERNPE